MASLTGNELSRLEDLIISGQKANETQLSAIAADLKILEKRLNALEVGQAEIKGDIKALDGKLTGDIKALDGKLTGDIKTLDGNLRGDIKTLDGNLRGDIKTLDTKVDGIGKRLENQEFISRGVLIALIVAILGGFAKLFGVVGNP